MSARNPNSRRQLQLLTLDERNLPTAIDAPSADIIVSNVVLLGSGIDPPGTPMHFPSIITMEYCFLRDDPSLRTQVEATLPLLESVAKQAVDYWAAQGISADQIADLQSAQFGISDLGEGNFALAVPNDHKVVIDDDGSGHGWISDELIVASSGDLTKVGRIDLLIVVIHEFGHILGRENERSGIMCNSLRDGPGLGPGIDGVRNVFDHPLVQDWLRNLTLNDSDSTEQLDPLLSDAVEQSDPLLSAWDPTADKWPDGEWQCEELKIDDSGSDGWGGSNGAVGIGELDMPSQLEPIDAASDFGSDTLIDVSLELGAEDIS